MPGRRPGSQLGARERQWINIPIAHQKKHATPDSLDRALTYFPLGCQVKKMTTANTIAVRVNQNYTYFFLSVGKKYIFWCATEF